MSLAGYCQINQLMSIFTSKKVWIFFTKIQLTKSNPKRVRSEKYLPSCQLRMKKIHLVQDFHNFLNFEQLEIFLVKIFYSWDTTKETQGPTVWPEPICIKVKKSWILLPQHQSTYPRGPESASIEIPPFRPKFTYQKYL